MKKFAKIYILLLCWSIGTIAAAPVKGETDSVLAAVNGEPVTLGEILPSLQDREFRLRSAYSGKALEQKILKLITLHVFFGNFAEIPGPFLR